MGPHASGGMELSPYHLNIPKTQNPMRNICTTYIVRHNLHTFSMVNVTTEDKSCLL